MCVNDSDCLLDEVCGWSGCVSLGEETDYAITASIIIGLMVIISLGLAYKYPVRDPDNKNMTLSSLLMALCFFPVYAIFVVAQNPIKTESGKPNWAMSVLVLLVFWPVFFVLMPKDGWTRQMPIGNP